MFTMPWNISRRLTLSCMWNKSRALLPSGHAGPLQAEIQKDYHPKQSERQSDVSNNFVVHIKIIEDSQERNEGHDVQEDACHEQVRPRHVVDFWQLGDNWELKSHKREQNRQGDANLLRKVSLTINQDSNMRNDNKTQEGQSVEEGEPRIETRQDYWAYMMW